MFNVKISKFGGIILNNINTFDKAKEHIEEFIIKAEKYLIFS